MPPIPGFLGVKIALWTPVSAGDFSGATESGSNTFYHKGNLATSMESSGGFFFFLSLFVSEQGLIQPGLVSYVAKDGTCDALAQPGEYF